MKFKLSFLFLLTIFISLQSPKQINAQNSYECAWEERNGVSSCIISEHQVTCEEGFYAGDACDNILNKEECLDAKWACNQIEPDQNRHTCVYTDTLGCRPTNTCVYGYTPSNACEGLNKDECLNVSPQSCVLKTKPIIRAKEKLICITNEGTEGINSAIGCISISNENENLIFLLTWAGGILGGRRNYLNYLWRVFNHVVARRQKQSSPGKRSNIFSRYGDRFYHNISLSFKNTRS